MRNASGSLFRFCNRSSNSPARGCTSAEAPFRRRAARPAAPVPPVPREPAACRLVVWAKSSVVRDRRSTSQHGWTQRPAPDAIVFGVIPRLPSVARRDYRWLDRLPLALHWPVLPRSCCSPSLLVEKGFRPRPATVRSHNSTGPSQVPRASRFPSGLKATSVLSSPGRRRTSFWRWRDFPCTIGVVSSPLRP